MSDLISSHMLTLNHVKEWWKLREADRNNHYNVVSVVFLCLQTINYSHHQQFQQSVSCSTFRSTALPLFNKNNGFTMIVST